MTMSTINDHLARLRKHVADLTARAEAAEGKLDIIKRRVDELMTVALTVRGMYFSRLRKYMRLRAQTGLLQMQRVQIEDPIHLYEMKVR